MKSIYKFLIIALILGIIAWIVFFVLSKNVTPIEPNNDISTSSTAGELLVPSKNTKTEEPTKEDSKSTTGDIPEEFIESGIIKTSFKKVEKLSDVPAHFYWYFEKNNRIFYTTDTGEIKKITDGKNETIQLNPLKNISMVRPNRTGSLVLIRFTGESGIVWGVFSSADEKVTPLNNSIIDAVWDFNDEDIVASKKQGEKISIVSLVASKIYSEETIMLPEIKLYDVDMIKKTPDELLFVEKFGNGYTTSIWQYNLKTKLFSTLKTGLLDFSLKPTLSAYFSLSKNAGFSIENASFERIIPTTHNTIPEKCSAAISTAICFIPKNSVSYFDWITNSVFTNDLLYIYDLSLQTEEEFQLSKITNESFDAKDINPTPSALYFINKYNNYIYAIK